MSKFIFKDEDYIKSLPNNESRLDYLKKKRRVFKEELRSYLALDAPFFNSERFKKMTDKDYKKYEDFFQKNGVPPYFNNDESDKRYGFENIKSLKARLKHERYIQRTEQIIGYYDDKIKEIESLIENDIFKNRDKNTDKPYTINGVSYRFHPQTGYNEAKKWLQEIGEWEYVSTHGFSTDGWSIVATANSMWDERNGS